MSTSPKVWLITGCSSGFGAALTLEALSRGDKVIATARNASKLADLKAAGADTLQLDVTAPLPDLKKKAEEAFKLYGRIDYLVNNAGKLASSVSFALCFSPNPIQDTTK
jgi:NAD(P)-dependent dehydrogenase (short-subunit alcohol dehydrogenase family)